MSSSGDVFPTVPAKRNKHVNSLPVSAVEKKLRHLAHDRLDAMLISKAVSSFAEDVLIGSILEPCLLVTMVTIEFFARVEMRSMSVKPLTHRAQSDLW